MARLVNARSTVKAVGAMLIAATVLACGAGARGGPVTTGEAGASTPAATSDLCGLFTAGELAPVLGAQPAPGSGGGPQETACLWNAGEADLMIQKVPVDYFEDPRAAEGYRQLDGIGDYAYVAGHAFGRVTAARTADAAYLVIASEGTDEAGQIEILRRFMERSPGAPALGGLDPSLETDEPVAPGSGSATDCAVSTEDVSEAAGIELAQGDGCSWVAADAGTLFEVLVRDVSMSLFELLKGAEPVPGVGDEAYTDETGALYVRVGDRAVTINVITLSLSEEQALDVAVAVAGHVVESLR
jgi:hypothetical protein